MEVSALNDIMFFLMLFFLIASTLSNPTVLKLLLPEAKSGNTVTKAPYSIEVSNDLKYYFNAEKSPLSFSQLEDRLVSISKNASDVTIVLKVDRTIQVQNLVDILALGSKLRIKMILATQPPK